MNPISLPNRSICWFRIKKNQSLLVEDENKPICSKMMEMSGTTVGFIMTLANSIIGVGILAMPFCFQKVRFFIQLLFNFDCGNPNEFPLAAVCYLRVDIIWYISHSIISAVVRNSIVNTSIDLQQFDDETNVQLFTTNVGSVTSAQFRIHGWVAIFVRNSYPPFSTHVQ